MKRSLPLISSGALSLAVHLGFIAVSLWLTTKTNKLTKDPGSRHSSSDAADVAIFLPLGNSQAKQRYRLPPQQPARAESPPASGEKASGTGGPADVWMIGSLRPDYPGISRRRGEEGRVTVSVLIGKDGTPTEVALSGSSGFSRLDEATVNFFRNARFGPDGGRL